jgi:hypothetical protein
MSTEHAILEKLQLLSEEDRKKVLELVESLRATRPPHPKKDPMGMFSHHAVPMPLEMFQEARREMWAE